MPRDPRKFWFFITYIKCPACGGRTRFMEKMFTPIPKNKNLRGKFIEQWDKCHFGKVMGGIR